MEIPAEMTPAMSPTAPPPLCLHLINPYVTPGTLCGNGGSSLLEIQTERSGFRTLVPIPATQPYEPFVSRAQVSRVLNLNSLMWVKKEIREPPESCKFPSETGAWPEASDLKKQG